MTARGFARAMAGAASRPVAYGHFQRAVLVLLAANTALYVWHGTTSEAVDTLAWFTLLVLFYWETETDSLVTRAAPAVAVRLARLAAGAAVTVTAIAYTHERVWLDAANSWLWIAVVLLLELEVRYPEQVEQHRGRFSAAAATLYGALTLLPLAWLAQAQWLAAYDAVLWLIAFATIEINVLSAPRPSAASSGALS